jgi:NAD+ synthase (glutamine-hydrolysing)
MKVLVAQLNPTIGDLDGNTAKVIQSLGVARETGCEVVLFPEMTICGYPPEDLLLHHDFVTAVEKKLEVIAPATKGLMAVVGLVRRNLSSGEKPLLNSAAIFQDGRLMGFHDKWLLPTYDVFDERRYFEPGKELELFSWKGKKIGVLICEDIWQHAGYVGYSRYPCDPVEELAKLKPDLLLNMSASPYQFQKSDVRLKVCEKAARTLKCPVLLCCQVGGNDQLVFDGYSIVVDEKGTLRQLGKGFEEDLMVVDLAHPLGSPSSGDPLADLYHALVLGVRDYFHKQGFTKGLLGLSGGIDSALVACIAVDALGKENVHGLLMPSRYSSPGSKADAEALAQNLGIGTDLLPIEEEFADFLKLLEPYFQGKAPDMTEENLQARIRGILLMAFSNKLGYILLSTGNKSELALGYCTLYGDMAGGLAAIGDVMKGQVYALSRWINRTREVIPKSSIEKPPSAELRPGQLDTDTLPDYAIVDTVVQAYVEEMLSVKEISDKYRLEIGLVKGLIHRIHLAEYKRRQAPPMIRVSKKAFRVGRRYPIVQKWM